VTDRHSLFHDAPDIEPVEIGPGLSAADLINYMGAASFEARNVHRGALLFSSMIQGGDVIWLGVAGAGIAGGMGGLVSSLIKAGFIDCICSTGAQVYHDLHFAFGLPVKAISPNADDDRLRCHGDTRIYDIGLREKETLQAQDELIRRFVRDRHSLLGERPLASWEFNYHLGMWVGEAAPHPEKSFVAVAAQREVPIFWDSLSNHSIAMNLARTDLEGYPVGLSAQRDIMDSAAVAFAAERSSFVELGGGGPKNFIQQTGPTISQILDIPYEGAQRGLQISTAVEREGSLSSCTFGEAVTWGKYRHTDESNLVQIWTEYSIVFPLLCAYVLDTCDKRSPKKLVASMDASRQRLLDARQRTAQ
jgi:deoxyhypusine synthase